MIRFFGKRALSSATSAVNVNINTIGKSDGVEQAPLIDSLPDLDKTASLEDLFDFVESARSMVVLTGAGISTNSGIPDYRGKNGVYTMNPGYKPINYGEFMKSENTRKRYWARAMAGWPTLSSAQPNACHNGLAQLEKIGKIGTIITQNVDGLHSKAGSKNVIELHGTLHQVSCMCCARVYPRSWYHRKLEEENGTQAETKQILQMNADGDVELKNSYENFKVVPCPDCNGIIKPRVVLFGENVESEIVSRALQAINRADAMLIMGTTLTVWSAMRLVAAAAGKSHANPKTIEGLKSFHGRSPQSTAAILLKVQGAHPTGIPIAIVNDGDTRGDALASLILRHDVADAVSKLAERYSEL